MDTRAFKAFVSAGGAAFDLHLSRERVVRLIQVGELRGKLVRGRWYVQLASLRAYKRKAAKA
jgi:hypothetical protein